MSDPVGSGSRSRWALKAALGIGLALAFGYFFLRGSRLGDVSAAMVAADPGALAAALAVAVLGFFVRAERWRCLLLPVKRIAFRTSFEILMIGYAVANFAPRGTDLVVRSALLRRAEQVPLATVLATTVVERLLDLLLLVMLFAGYLGLCPPSGLGDVPIEMARSVGFGLLALSLGAVVALILLRLKEAACFALLAKLVRPLPARLAARLLDLARSFAAGLDLFRGPRQAMVAFGWTLLAWFTVGASMWLVTQAMGIVQVRPLDSLLLMGLGVVGIAVPAPGGVGSFHYFILQGLRGLGLGEQNLDIGKAAAILMWALSVVPTSLLGVVAALRRGLGPGSIGSSVEPEARP